MNPFGEYLNATQATPPCSAVAQRERSRQDDSATLCSATDRHALAGRARRPQLAANGAVGPYQANVGILAAARQVTSSSVLTMPGPAARKSNGSTCTRLAAPMAWACRSAVVAARPSPWINRTLSRSPSVPARRAGPRRLPGPCHKRHSGTRPSSIMVGSGESGYDAPCAISAPKRSRPRM